MIMVKNDLVTLLCNTSSITSKGWFCCNSESQDTTIKKEVAKGADDKTAIDTD